MIENPQENLDQTMLRFKTAVGHWSAAQPGATAGRHFVLPEKRRFAVLPRIGWAVAVAGLFLALSPLYRALTTTTPEVADNVLFEQVDAAVSQTVPQPMRPLLNLIAVDGNEQENYETPTKQ